MDLSTFLASYRPLRAEDVKEKLAALRYAYNQIQDSANLSFPNFIKNLPHAITGHVFGSESDSFYFTSLLASLAQYQDNIDPFFVAVVNRIVLQLNFGTRFIGIPEVLVVDGADNLLAPMLANGNGIIGFAVSNVASTLPDPSWGTGLPHITLRSNFMFEQTITGLPGMLKELNRDRIGCLVLAIGESELLPSDIVERYATLAPMLHDHSFFVLQGAPEIVLDAMKQVQSALPKARITGRLYRECLGKLRAIAVFSGIAGLPPIVLNVARRRLFVSGWAAAADGLPGFVDLKYFEDSQKRYHEVVQLSKPLALVTAAPMSHEARLHVTAPQIFPHRALEVEGGGIFASVDQFHCTYVHLDGQGRIINDVGEFHNLPNTLAVKNGGIDKDGTQFAVTSLTKIIHVDGVAIPLAFTPTLHHFFSHFLLQCFPRVLILEDIGDHGKILVPPTLRAKQRDMLNLVGFSDDRIVVIPPDTLVTADRLIIPQPWPLTFSPYTLRIYDRLIAKFGQELGLSTRRVLISRETSMHWRNMLTYDAVKDLLVNKYGFEVVKPEDLSLEQEIRIFRDAAVIVGAEGAGLYAACYSRQGQLFISISDEDYVMGILASATSGRGSDIAYCLGESYRADSDVARRKSYGHSEFSVAPSLVEKLLDVALPRMAAQNRNIDG